MPKLPSDKSGNDVIAALERLGFSFVRQSGSHVVLRRLDPIKNRVAVVPAHKRLARGTISGILKQAGIDRDEFLSVI
ncbi:MAG: type II toxin-antitoxin system HicA family toxin [Gemmatimonadota bacterium]|nr:type II toxin-antitoxin system HicA family toxin [Gemmatimonadota bacterium]